MLSAPNVLSTEYVGSYSFGKSSLLFCWPNLNEEFSEYRMTCVYASEVIRIARLVCCWTRCQACYIVCRACLALEAVVSSCITMAVLVYIFCPAQCCIAQLYAALAGT